MSLAPTAGPAPTGLGLNSLFTGGVSGVTAGVSSIFAGIGQGYSAQAQQVQAQAAQQQALATETQAQAEHLEAQGDILEGQMYGSAATLAELNATYTQFNTRIEEVQSQRQTYMAIGSEKAAAGASGETTGGSVGDILRASASQGALNRATIAMQGQITMAGYNEQAVAYTFMQQASQVAAQAQDTAAESTEEAAQVYTLTAQADSDAAQATQAQQTGSFLGGAISGLGGLGQLGILAVALA
jgi:hypothetical protein